MKFASIIAIAAALAFTAEAKKTQGQYRRIPENFWENPGTLLGCGATNDDPVGVGGPIGGGFMH